MGRIGCSSPAVPVATPPPSTSMRGLMTLLCVPSARACAVASAASWGYGETELDRAAGLLAIRDAAAVIDESAAAFAESLRGETGGGEGPEFPMGKFPQKRRLSPNARRDIDDELGELGGITGGRLGRRSDVSSDL